MIQRDPEDEARPVRRVLVADDDPDLNRLVGVRLESRGYEVISVADGTEALDAIEQRRVQSPAELPDLLFLDVSMPVMGGLDVLARVRAERLDLAVIIMTAHGSEGVAVDAMRRGADDYLRKPFERDEFLGVLERTVSRLGLRRQNDALRRQLDERRRQLEAELARAAQVQIDLLPRHAPDVAGYDVAGRCVPALQVGGDFFDWQVCDDGRLLLTLGDVMGKGMPAALLMATARAALRAVSDERLAENAVSRAAAALDDDLDRSGSFVTLFRAHIDLGTHRLSFVDAGHGHVFLRRAGGEVETLAPRSLPLGAFAEYAHQGGSVALEAGDCLVVYSDGLPDSLGDAAPSTAQLAALAGSTASAAEVVERLIHLAPTTAALPDDLTVVVVRRVT